MPKAKQKVKVFVGDNVRVYSGGSWLNGFVKQLSFNSSNKISQVLIRYVVTKNSHSFFYNSTLEETFEKWFSFESDLWRRDPFRVQREKQLAVEAKRQQLLQLQKLEEEEDDDDDSEDDVIFVTEEDYEALHQQVRQTEEDIEFCELAQLVKEKLIKNKPKFKCTCAANYCSCKLQHEKELIYQPARATNNVANKKKRNKKKKYVAVDLSDPVKKCPSLFDEEQRVKHASLIASWVVDGSYDNCQELKLPQTNNSNAMEATSSVSTYNKPNEQVPQISSNTHEEVMNSNNNNSEFDASAQRSNFVEFELFSKEEGERELQKLQELLELGFVLLPEYQLRSSQLLVALQSF